MELLFILIAVGLVAVVAIQLKSSTRVRQPVQLASRNAGSANAPLASRLTASAKNLELSFCPPPLADKTEFKVASQSSSGAYLVSLATQTCTCADFLSARTAAPKNHMSRCCKHLLTKLLELGVFDGADKWIVAICKSGRGGPQAAWVVERESSPEVAISLSQSKEWINVYAHSLRKKERIANASGPIKEYGWSIPEQRWSYGDAPPGARELRKLLAEIEGIN